MIDSKKLGVSALVLIAAMISVGIYCIIKESNEEREKMVQYNIDQRLKDLEKASKNKDFKYNYYDNLRKKCDIKDSYNCCLASVDNLEELNVKASGEGKCEEGFKKNTLKCIDSYSWCEKDNSSQRKNVDNSVNNLNKISISELINSNIAEGRYVRVKGFFGKCVDLKVTDDYEGLPSGCRIHDKNNKAVSISMDINSVDFEEDTDITVEGYVAYCGGKKRDKYICSLKVIKISDNNFEFKKKGDKKNNPFKKRKEDVVCTQEVKKCPDGSFVSRNGYDCKFDKCQ